MKFMKKSQTTEIFIYALGVIIMGLVVIFAYKGIKVIMTTSDQADLQKFKTDFTNTIDEMSSYGRRMAETINTPRKFQWLCLINKDNPSNGDLKDIVRTSVSAGSDNTVYLVTATGDTVEGFKTDPLEVGVDKTSKCFDISNGRIKLSMEGFTDYTKVSEVQETAG